MANPTWQTEQACEEVKIRLNLNTKWRDVTHGELPPDKWTNLMMTCFNNDNKNCWRLCCKYLPLPYYNYPIDLFLAETVDTLKDKIQFFKNECKEDIEYDENSIWQGNRLAVHLWFRMLTRKSGFNVKTEQSQAAWPLRHLTGLPNFSIIQTFISYRPRQDKPIKRDWMKYNADYRNIKGWTNLSMIEFARLHIKANARGDAFHCIAYGLNSLAIEMDSQLTCIPECVFNGTLGENDIGQSKEYEYLYHSDDFKVKDININPVVSQYCDVQAETVKWIMQG